MTRREKATELRRRLAEYRGCRFSAGGSGGARGMVFVKYPNGDEYFVGGFHSESDRLVRALNLVLDLIYDK